MFQLLQSGGGLGMLLPLLMIPVLYFFFLRPQMKKQKDAENLQKGLGKGDKIVTIGGIHAKINKVNEDGTFEIETSPGSYLKISKTAVSMEMTKELNAVPTETKK